MESIRKAAISSAPMQLLRVGDNHDFSSLRDLLRDSAAWRSPHELSPNPAGAPLNPLPDHMNTTVLDTVLKTGAGDFAQSFRVDKPSVAGTMPYALDEYREKRNARRRRIPSANYGARSSNRRTWS